ncbi:major facilitator superfamily domain-containing protein [Talaromyces proteolyticus]|uniref:Major facilitator superfamily domain-containing protein n=1 Tax=Talaromyces proteolyticus TaxID=1131652 RepID=A0AAD4KDL3_9EURO|nr:major facilitator superfamily domain-containing protein [Talaromyces proteolyticus]KAH8689061.1 major facilitator superfamily domain-containing protein [Talaromyces proteolyticus]
MAPRTEETPEAVCIEVSDWSGDAERLETMVDSDREQVRRIQRKVDMRLVLPLGLLYTMAFLDRSNLGNVAVAGLSTQLHLNVGSRYSIIAMIFFISYIIIDLPATWLVRKLGATVWIPSIAVAWGVLTIGQGFVKTWGQLAACRFLLGFCEGGLVPAAIYLLSVWYSRFEIQLRFAGFYLLGIASSGLSGLLALGIERMNGDAGLEGWRWIFIIEGIMSCVVAIASFFILVDLPEKATRPNIFGFPAWLSEQDVAILVNHVHADRGSMGSEKFSTTEMLAHLRDVKIWEFSALLLLNNTCLYAFAYFLPTILEEGLGYSVSKSQLMTFWPYAVAVPWILLVAWLSDRFKTRGPAMVFNSLLYIIGASMMGFCHDPSTRYGGVFIGVVGICGNVPANFGYQHNNTVGKSKLALCAGMLTIGGALGGVISGNIFQSKEAPRYTTGLSICIAFQATAALIVTKNFFVFSRANRQADRGERIIENQPGFRYTL